MGMELPDGWEIEGLDAYPKLEARKRFPTKKHMLAECPRHGETVDIIFTGAGRPLCLSVLGMDECDFCWAYNLIHKKDIPESLVPQILEEAPYWQNLKTKYTKHRSCKKSADTPNYGQPR